MRRFISDSPLSAVAASFAVGAAASYGVTHYRATTSPTAVVDKELFEKARKYQATCEVNSTHTLGQTFWGEKYSDKKDAEDELTEHRNSKHGGKLVGGVRPIMA